MSVQTQFQIDAAITSLAAFGAPAGAAQSQAEFTRGMDLSTIGSIMDADIPGDLDLLRGIAKGIGSIGSFLQGIGDDRPAQSVDRAAGQQQEHEGQVCACQESTQQALEVMGSLDAHCAGVVAGIADKARLLAAAASSVTGAPNGMCQGIAATAMATIGEILGVRNQCLGLAMDQAIADHIPAQALGEAIEPVCRAPEPSPGECPDRVTTPPVVETPTHEESGNPVEVPEEAAACVETGSPAEEPVAACASQPELSQPTECVTASLPEPPKECVPPLDNAPAAHCPTQPAWAAPLATPTEVLAPAREVSPVSAGPVHIGEGFTSLVSQLIRGIEDLSCPPEASAEPDVSIGPTSSSVVELAATPEFAVEGNLNVEIEPAEVEPACSCECACSCGAEPADESCPPEPEHREPEPGEPEPSEPKHCEPEPVVEDPCPPEEQPSDQQIGFDKSSHPSVPEEVAEAIREVRDRAVAPEAAPPLEEQPQPEPPAPLQAPPEPPMETAADHTWAPDIWVHTSASLQVDGVMIASADAPDELKLERSGQW